MSAEERYPPPATDELVCEITPPRVSTRRVILRSLARRRLFLLGAVVIVALVVVAAFAPWIAPHDPYKQELRNTKAAPSLEHPLGTDTLGRDTLSRLIYGSRTSLLVGIVAVIISGAIGATLGTVAGFFGGWMQAIIMRFIDALMTFPMILLALTLAALLGGGLRNVVIALGISMVPPYARLMNALTISIKERDYVAALRSMGARRLRIVGVHILPNAVPPVLVFATLQIGAAILAEAGLSFLGIGIDPPGAAWGAMVSEGYRYLLTNPILSLAPGLAIMIVVFAFNMAGDGLRDAVDPRLRGTL
ncbi:MAG: ABC transporter permease [Thermoleophilia bacterium]